MCCIDALLFFIYHMGILTLLPDMYLTILILNSFLQEAFQNIMESK